MADLSNTKLVDLLPASISGDANVIAAASAIDGELQKVTALIPEAVLIARIDVLPEKVLDLLAWQWHVDFYEPVGFGVEKKRAVIKNSIAWHRKKGTPWAVAQVVSATFDTADIQEWFTYGGDPYHFRIKHFYYAWIPARNFHLPGTISTLQDVVSITLLHVRQLHLRSSW